jgi:hypothetical protein
MNSRDRVRPSPGRSRSPAPWRPRLPWRLPRRTSPPRAPPGAPFSPPVPEESSPAAPPAAGRASQIFSHLDDLPHRRRELGVPGDLAAHLAHLARRELTGDGLPPARRPGPKEPWLVPGMLRGRARAVRLHTPAPVLTHRPPTYVSHTLGLDGHSAPTVRRSRRSSKRLGICSGEGSPSRVHNILD